MTLYYLIRKGVAFVDPGQDYFERLDHCRREHSLIRQLERMDYQVLLRPARGCFRRDRQRYVRWRSLQPVRTDPGSLFCNI